MTICDRRAPVVSEYSHPPDAPVLYVLRNDQQPLDAPLCPADEGLSWELLTFAEFVEANGELDPADLDEIRLLAPGEVFRGGGGAQPVWSIERRQP